MYTLLCLPDHSLVVFAVCGGVGGGHPFQILFSPDSVIVLCIIVSNSVGMGRGEGRRE